MAVIALFAMQSAAHGKNLENAQYHIFSPGEQLNITILNEDDLSDTYKIDESGMILMPLIGKIQIKGKNPFEVEEELTNRYKDGYLIDPVIAVRPDPDKEEQQSISVKLPPNVRNIYILGGVRNPGRYTLPPDAQHILSAVALAGGFTHRANTKKFKIMRGEEEFTYRTNNDDEDYTPTPGDIIIVQESFF